MIEVTLSDGNVVQFPDGTSPQEMKAVLDADFPETGDTQTTSP